MTYSRPDNRIGYFKLEDKRGQNCLPCPGCTLGEDEGKCPPTIISKTKGILKNLIPENLRSYGRLVVYKQIEHLEEFFSLAPEDNTSGQQAGFANTTGATAKTKRAGKKKDQSKYCANQEVYRCLHSTL